MKSLCILKAGSKLPSLVTTAGDFHDWVISGMRVTAHPIRTVDARREELPHYEDLSGVVITGSSAMVTDHEPWSERAAQWLIGVVQHDIPMLGICYGHQLLAYALGGKVSDNPAGIEVGTVKTTLTDNAQNDLLLKGLSSPLTVQASHKQSVRELPAHAVRLASSLMDVNHAFRMGEHVWGLQFHPEFDAQITRRYIDYYRTQLRSQKVNADQLIRQCKNTGVGSLILQRFYKYLTER